MASKLDGMDSTDDARAIEDRDEAHHLLDLLGAPGKKGTGSIRERLGELLRKRFGLWIEPHARTADELYLDGNPSSTLAMDPHAELGVHVVQILKNHSAAASQLGRRSAEEKLRSVGISEVDASAIESCHQAARSLGLMPEKS